jgi:hypothetical protein
MGGGGVTHDCSDCKHSEPATLEQAQRLRKEQAYAQGAGAYLHDKGVVCLKWRLVAPRPTYGCGWEQRIEPPSDDGTTGEAE